MLIYIDNEEECVRRIKIRDPNLSEHDVRARIKNQINYLVKMRLSDVCINNSGDFEDSYK